MNLTYLLDQWRKEKQQLEDPSWCVFTRMHIADHAFGAHARRHVQFELIHVYTGCI